MQPINSQTLTRDIDDDFVLPDIKLVNPSPNWSVSSWTKLLQAQPGGGFVGKIPGMGAFLFEMWLDTASDAEIYECLNSVSKSFRYPFKNAAYKEVIVDFLNGLDSATKDSLGLQWIKMFFSDTENIVFIQKPSQEPIAGMAVRPVDDQFSCHLLVRMRRDDYSRQKAGLTIIKYLKKTYLKKLYEKNYLWLYADCFHPKTEAMIKNFNKGKIKWKCLGEGEAHRRDGLMYVPKKYRLNLKRFVEEELV